MVGKYSEVSWEKGRLKQARRLGPTLDARAGRVRMLKERAKKSRLLMRKGHFYNSGNNIIQLTL